MSLLICHGCGGRKQVAPLGGMPKDCAICKGVGHLVHDDSISVMLQEEIREILPETHIVNELTQRLSKKQAKRSARNERELRRYSTL